MSLEGSPDALLLYEDIHQKVYINTNSTSEVAEPDVWLCPIDPFNSSDLLFLTVNKIQETLVKST